MDEKEKREMKEFIGWPMIVMAMSIGAIVGIAVAWWQTSREIDKAKKDNRR